MKENVTVKQRQLQKETIHGYYSGITQELQVEKWQIEAAVKLIDEGNTIPFYFTI